MLAKAKCMKIPFFYHLISNFATPRSFKALIIKRAFSPLRKKPSETPKTKVHNFPIPFLIFSFPKHKVCLLPTDFLSPQSPFLFFLNLQNPSFRLKPQFILSSHSLPSIAQRCWCLGFWLESRGPSFPEALRFFLLRRAMAFRSAPTSFIHSSTNPQTRYLKKREFWSLFLSQGFARV